MLQLAESPLRESFAHPRPAGDKVAMKASYRLPQLLLLAIDFREMTTSFIIRYLSWQAHDGFCWADRPFSPTEAAAALVNTCRLLVTDLECR
jgi:hypothetical protein